MNELQASLKIVLANTYTMYFKAHSYHWNVEGMFFSLFHQFFGNLYEELYSSVDDIAEHIRAVDGYGPFSFHDMLGAGTVREDMARPNDVKTMLSNLLEDNTEIVASLNKAFDLAEQHDLQGLMNFIAERLDAHAKHGWMLKSTLKQTGE